MLSAIAVQEKLRALRLRPTRDRGQNFMIAAAPLAEMLAAAEIHAGEKILEIGPGLGALTNELLQSGAVVVAVEQEEKLANFLRQDIPAKYPCEIITGDVLRVASENFLAALGKYKVVANIPYQISGALVRHFVESATPPERLVLLMQKEVAEKLSAEPPQLTLGTALMQWRARVQYVAPVARKNFWPIPAVDSAIICFWPQRGAAARFKLDARAEKQLLSLLKRGFSNPRKQLGNNLGIENSAALRQKFDFTRRAETLEWSEWINLLKILSTP